MIDGMPQDPDVFFVFRSDPVVLGVHQWLLMRDKPDPAPMEVLGGPFESYAALFEFALEKEFIEPKGCDDDGCE